MIFGKCSHVGQVRKANEDYCYVSQQGDAVVLAVVADGMGGHNAGEIASKMTVETIVKRLVSTSAQQAQKPPLARIREAVEEANRLVHAYSLEDSACNGMGTTVTLALMLDQTVYVANVGDSRTYYLSAQSGELVRITRDHSLVEELIATGKLMKDQAKAYVFRNVITRAIGAGKTVNVDLFDADWNRGDMLLLCTDGLTTHIEDEEIAQILVRPYSPQEICDQLVSLALERGGRDNVTVVVALNDGASACEKGGEAL